MVCIAGRAGQLSEAEKLLVSMPLDEWNLMQVHCDLCLGACPIYGSNLKYIWRTADCFFSYIP